MHIGKNTIAEDLKNRALPELMLLKDGRTADSPELWDIRRDEIIELLGREIYGYSPLPPKNVTAVLQQKNELALAGKAEHSELLLKFDTPKGESSFPFDIMIPKTEAEVPLFLHIAFRPDIPDKYLPVEEIIDGGFAVASFCYSDAAADIDDGFTGGLAGMYASGARKPTDWGKISIWAWAASRVMDYITTLEGIDKGRIAVVGHSRLGKTALWCAAQDKRFCMAISNDSGCSGAAITRSKKGEHVKDIIKNFGYWFCENYSKYADNERTMPFDQHFLLAAVAPRPVYVSSAENDEWADPQSEFLCCAASSEAYELLGERGLIYGHGYPEAGTSLHEGSIGYHIRTGTHFLSRYDWQRFMEYMKMHS